MIAKRVLISCIVFIGLLSLGRQQGTAAGESLAYSPFTGPRMFYSPISLDFGPVGVGSTSPVQSVTITNTGSVLLTNFAGGNPGAPFGASQNCAGGVAPGATCQISYSFSPTQAGAATGTSSISTNAGTITIYLQGTGVGAAASVSPLVIDFGPVLLGTTSSQQIVTIKNTGLATLANFAGGSPGAPFNATQNCAGGVAPGGSCQYFFSFSPTSPGRFHRTSSSSSNGGNIVIELWGGELLKTYLPLVTR